MAEYRDGVLTIRLGSDKFFGRKMYLISDVHFDSVYADRELFIEHLRRAKDEGAMVVLGGDFFDAMQGRFDPRRNMDDLRPEYRREDYYDFVVRDACRVLEPYADLVVMVCQGNHELGVLKNANTNLTDRLVYSLREKGSDVVMGGWKGWIRVILRRDKQQGAVLIYYSHSAGDGSAPVTRGVIGTNRQAVYLPDADVIWNGHNHHAYIVPIARERLSTKGKRYRDMGWFVRSPGYKREWDSDSGFAAQKGFGPRPLGCVVATLEIGKYYPRVVSELLVS